MATRINLLPIKPLPRLAILQQTHTKPPQRKLKIFCSKKKKKSSSINDAELAVDLAAEVAKVNTHAARKQEALNKSKELLFTELCNYMGLGHEEEQVKKQWREMMDEDEKWVLIKGFVSDWALHFHPLSARSVKDMVDEYLFQDNVSSSSSATPTNLLHVFKRFIGFAER